MHPVQEIVQRNKAGRQVGVYSCCSANEDVVKAVLLKAKKTRTIVLVESTSNQVNQFGGYTGMTPADFAAFVYDLAAEVGLESSRVILGGDHLGPLPWVDEPEEEAMEKASELIRQCVLAGYSKIHIDTSMRVGSDDKQTALSVETCARRGAELCFAAEEAAAKLLEFNPDLEKPVYVLGSEVPIPGGACDDTKIGVSDPMDCALAIQEYRQAFGYLGLSDAFDRVIAFVVEMGVEFHEYKLDEYDPEEASRLILFMQNTPLAIEGHSTDYQTTENLKRMVGDGCAILKVGPALTFSLREALFSMEGIEQRLFEHQPEKLSRFRRTLEEAMMRDDRHWRKYYTGTKEQQAISRAYSFYDRSRYYFSLPEVKKARDILISNLSEDVIPLCMLSQYMPNQYYRIRMGELINNSEDIIFDKIGDRIDNYLYATKNNGEL